MLAKNWLLARLALSASSLASRKSCVSFSSASRSCSSRRCRLTKAPAASSSNTNWATVSQMIWSF